MIRAGVVELKKSCLPRLCLDTLSHENVVFSKMLYRARNQHRHDKSFQRMNGVSKQINKYMSVNLLAKVKMIIDKLFSLKATVRSLPPDTVGLIEDTYLQLLESATFTADLLQFTEDTWREVNQRLVRSLFVPFNTIMLASLSRIWFCLRFHLLGIAETYAVLKNTALKTQSPVSHVSVHLKQCQRRYLDSPALQHLQPPASEPSASVGRTGSQQKGSLAMDDTGVAVHVSEREQQARMSDFELPSRQPVPSDRAILPPHSTGINTVASGSQEVAAVNSGEVQMKKKKKKNRKRKRTCEVLPSTMEPPSLTSVSPANVDDSQPTAKEKRKERKKKHKCRETRAKHLQRERAQRPIGGNFRQIVMKQSGSEKFIIGSKVWTAKRTSKRKRKTVAHTGSNDPATPSSSCSMNRSDDSGLFGEGERVSHMQALFQFQLDRAAESREKEARTTKQSATDDIDTIFSNLQ